MKKIIVLFFALSMIAVPTYAYKAIAHQTIAALAQKHLTDKAQSEVKAILKADMAKNAMWLYSLRKNESLAYTQQWQFSTLNAEGKSVTTDPNDGVVALENAIAVLRDRANQSDSLVKASLLTAIQIVGDLHTISNIYIDGNEATKGFDFTVWNNLKGKGEKHDKSKWRSLWHNYTNRHDVFSAEYYVADIEIFLGHKKAEYEGGTPRQWVENVGGDVVRCLEVVYPDADVNIEIINRWEDIHNKCMAKAGYRLAALLNDIFK